MLRTSESLWFRDRMGTWSDGLWDNDDALDVLGELMGGLEVEMESSPAHFATGLGLQLWIRATALSRNPKRALVLLSRHEARMSELPLDARELLVAFRVNPASVMDKKGARSERARQVLGDYCSGPRHDAILHLPAGRPVIEALANACRAQLDEAAGAAADLYEGAGSWAPLGVLLELRELGVANAADRVTSWRNGFQRADQMTTEEREFWDGYVRRVLPAFEALGA